MKKIKFKNYIYKTKIREYNIKKQELEKLAVSQVLAVIFDR